MHVIIAGATGFIGQNLCSSLVADNIPVIALSRNAEKATSILGDGVECLSWDGKTLGPWRDRLEGAAAVVNLAGANVGERWTASHKKSILNSRINATAVLVKAIEGSTDKPGLLLQGSAIGYYGSKGDQLLDENSPKGSGFLANVVDLWEEQASLNSEQTRIVYLRTGVVLGKGEGMLAKMTLPFQLFAGGPLGSGNQWISWIHINDQVAVMRHLMEHDHLKGIFNCNAPNPVQMSRFVEVFGKVLGRPSWLPVPAFALKLLLQDMAEETVLASQRVSVQKLLQSGFQFSYPEIEGALKALLA